MGMKQEQQMIILKQAIKEEISETMEKEIQEIHNVRQYLDNMQTSHVNEDTRTKQNEKHGEKRKVYHEVEDNKSKKKRKCVKFPMMNKRELFWNEKYSELREHFNLHG